MPAKELNYNIGTVLKKSGSIYHYTLMYIDGVIKLFCLDTHLYVGNTFPVEKFIIDKKVDTIDFNAMQTITNNKALQFEEAKIRDLKQITNEWTHLWFHTISIRNKHNYISHNL